MRQLASKVLVPLVFAATVFAVPASAADKAEIMAVDQAFSDMSAREGMRAAFAHYLAPNAVKLDGGAHPRFGHDEILPTFGDPSPDISLTWTPRDGKVAASGDLAFTWGTYILRVTRDGDTGLSYGKYTTIWEKRAGTWKAVLDIGNPSPGPYAN